VASCVARGVRNAQFDAPGGAGASLTFSLKFDVQK
jgi:hypothetical protein